MRQISFGDNLPTHADSSERSGRLLKGWPSPLPPPGPVPSPSGTDASAGSALRGQPSLIRGSHPTDSRRTRRPAVRGDISDNRPPWECPPLLASRPSGLAAEYEWCTERTHACSLSGPRASRTPSAVSPNTVRRFAAGPPLPFQDGATWRATPPLEECQTVHSTRSTDGDGA